MNSNDSNEDIHRRFFHLLLLVVTVALFWILLPYFSAIFWGVMLALLFHPVQRRLVVRLRNRRNLATLITLLAAIILVIVPLLVVTMSVINDIGLAYGQIQSGQINPAEAYGKLIATAPHWAQSIISRFGLNDISSLQHRLTEGAAQISSFVGAQALAIGQHTLEFVVGFGVMLFLVFFLLRDGPYISRLIRRALPLDEEHKSLMIAKFTTVARATIKGNVVVAAVQGALGGIIFAILGIQGALLWGVLMAFLSLLPAVGAAIVWGPAALYLFATGSIWKGAILVFFCVVVIGLVDNFLRPLLVGKDTRMPDWVILISTLGGMSLFGINGFVIGPLIAALFLSGWSLFAQEEAADRRT
ncbi:putative PurR-regulated permease PerM [Paraburkholderia sp. GAS199]|uniref:AI-2E family transporter n=1 Tax=Paraburkholderia sp. GAS199 TaxID=3035126 RepID=UPI003D229566